MVPVSDYERLVGNAEVTSINVFLADDAPLGDAEPLASAITGVMELTYSQTI
jgi:hypothetical protein